MTDRAFHLVAECDAGFDAGYAAACERPGPSSEPDGHSEAWLIGYRHGLSLGQRHFPRASDQEATG